MCSLAQGLHRVRRAGGGGRGGRRGGLPDWASLGMALASPRGLRWHTPPPWVDVLRLTSRNTPGPGVAWQRGSVSGVLWGGHWPAPMSTPLAPQPEPPCQVETALTACGCRMWFWNFPTPPAIGCPAPHTLPQAQIGHVGRLSSYPLHPRGGGGWWSGGLSLGHLCGASLNPPLPRSIGGELGAELQTEALPRGPCPNPAASCTPSLDPLPKKDREPRQRGKPTAQP